MRRARLAVTSLCAAAAVTALPAPAHAANVPWQITAVGSTYVVGDVVITPGDSLTFTNADPFTHDIVALDTSGGAPLFRSAIVGTGQQAPVVGVSSLPVGRWPFLCSVHEFMSGSIEVREL